MLIKCNCVLSDLNQISEFKTFIKECKLSTYQFFYVKNLQCLYVINYFGFPADWELVNNLKKELGLFIIEDNAHSPFSKYRDTNLGSLGDMSFNSLRKFLPLLSGSELYIKNTDENEFFLPNR